MKKPRKQKKSFTYSIAILVVLTMFLLGYFFYFIPGNKSTIHKNGFLVLQTIASNIEDKSSGHLSFFVNIYKNARNNDSLVLELLKENNINALFEHVRDTVKNRNAQSKLEKGKNKDSIYSTITIKNESFVFTIRNRYSGDGMNFSEKASDFLGRILVTEKEELFTSYALAMVNGSSPQMIFADRELGFRSDISLDSLLPRNIQAYLPGIREISFHDFNQKMFYSSFKVETIQLVLCGFTSTQHYNATIQKLPLKFVYPFAIAFLLLLVFIPILKFYIMDSNEQVTIRDLAWFALSVFIGISVLTLGVIQYLLWQGEEVRVTDNLRSLSIQIEQSFEQELQKGYTQLSIMDSIRKSDKSLDSTIKARDSIRKNNKELKSRINNGTVQYSNVLLDSIRKLNRDGRDYYHFERISWVDSNGQQVVKAEMEGKPVFTNVKERGYFKAFKDNTTFFLRDGSGRAFGWEPIYSWTNADFNISMSKKTEGFYIAVLATKMYSVMGALLPLGYGFCMIDADGKVMLHSDVNRNLRENLFEKAQPSENLSGSVAAHQDTTLNDINMYGKWHMMYVHRLKAVPYSLVTFYDKGFIMPVNIRILIFALLFCLLSALFCTILWLLLSPVQLNKYPFNYCRLDCISWVTPREKEAKYYFYGSIFLLAYVILFLSFVRLYNSYYISNYTVFSLLLFTPLNVISCLFTIRATCTLSRDELNRVEKTKLKWKVVAVAITHGLLSIMFYAYAVRRQYPIDPSFLFLQAFFHPWIWRYIFLKIGKPSPDHKSLPDNNVSTEPLTRKYKTTIKGKFSSIKKKSQNYLVAYNLMLTFLVISLSVLPSAFYTWYAHNQEIIQTLKKQQLNLATGINKRRNSISNMAGFKDPSLVPDNYSKKVLYEKGIYTINQDDLKWGTTTNSQHAHLSTDDPPSSQSFDRFYFSIAETVSNPYYGSQLYPALEDYGADSSWVWNVRDSSLHFCYKSLAPLREADVPPNQFLHITSLMPSRFVFVNTGTRGLLLGLFILFLAYILFKWLRVNTRNLFLIKFVQTASSEDTSKMKGLVAKAYDQGLISRPAEDEDFYHCSDYAAYSVSKEENELQETEKKVLELARKGNPVYDFIWNKCTEKERYLMYNFADSGLINYKNTNEIYGMISKGILTVNDGKIKLFSPGFRAYIMTNSDSREILDLRQKHYQNSTWQSLQGPLTILILGSASLIFFTQEAMFQKLLALAGGIGSLLTLIPKFLSSGSNTTSEYKTEKGVEN